VAARSGNFLSSMPNVLVVEDELLIRLHVADYLRDHGFEVLEAGDGTRALEILQREPSIDAVFTDVSLPGEPDGFGIARWVRKHRPAVPVLLTSGEVSEAHARRMAGDEPFFAKPCDYAEVVKLIRRRLAQCGAD
jgi:DNA-binding response OmpR family regulator